MSGALEVAGKKDDGDEVEESSDHFGPAVFGFAVFASAVLDGNFGDTIVLFGGENGDITVEFAVEIEIFEDLFFVGFEAAVGVVDFDAGE